MFASQMARRDNATVMAMKLLFWLIKENLALEKWNSLKGLVDFLGVEEISRLRLGRNAYYASTVARDDMLGAL